MSPRASRYLFLAFWLVGSPAAAYGVIMLLTDGTGLIRDNWPPLLFVLPPLFTVLAGWPLKRSRLQLAITGAGSIGMTIAEMVFLFVLGSPNLN